MSSRKTAAALTGIAEYWPNVVDEHVAQAPRAAKTPDACGLFCEYYPRKNLATALFAIKMMGKHVWCARTIPQIYVDLAREFNIRWCGPADPRRRSIGHCRRRSK